MKIRKALVAIMLVFAVVSLQAFDQDWLNNITFSNDTGYDMWYLFMSPSDSDEWGADILGSTRTLDDGDSLGFFVWYPNECDTFDILAIDADEDAYIIWGYEMCDGYEETIEFTLDDISDETIDLNYVTVEILNDLGYDVWYTFLSPADSEMWGVDQLDEETVLEPGDSLELLVAVSDGHSTEYDFRAVDEDMDTYTFSLELDASDDEVTYLIESSDID